MPPPGLNQDTIQHHSALVSHCKRKCGNVEDWNKLVVSQSLMLHILYYHVSSVAFHSISPMCLFVIKQSNIIHHEQHHLQPRNQQYLDYDCVGSIVRLYVATNCTDIVFIIGGFTHDTLWDHVHLLICCCFAFYVLLTTIRSTSTFFRKISTWGLKIFSPIFAIQCKNWQIFIDKCTECCKRIIFGISEIVTFAISLQFFRVSLPLKRN